MEPRGQSQASPCATYGGNVALEQGFLRVLRAPHTPQYHSINAPRPYFIHIQQTLYTRVGTLIVATIYLQLIQNRYMFRSFTVLQCSHQHCVQPVPSDVEVVGYL